MKRRSLGTILLAGGLALVLSACGQDQGPEQDGQAITVVTSTNVYGDIVRTIGGDRVEVVSIIERQSQDPHSYEATARDKLAISKADLLIVNGGGYDTFMFTIAEDLGIGGEMILAAVDGLDGSGGHDDGGHEASHDEGGHETGLHDEAGHDDGGHAGHDHSVNEHVWYHLPAMAILAEDIAVHLAELDAANADLYEDNAEQFSSVLAGVRERLSGLAQDHAGTDVAVTEPVPAYLLEEAGLVDRTPPAFSNAIENETDVPPMALQELQDVLMAGDVALLAYNEQTEGAQTRSVKETAEAAGVPVIGFTETLPEGESYLEWMDGNVTSVESALKSW